MGRDHDIQHEAIISVLGITCFCSRDEEDAEGIEEWKEKSSSFRSIAILQHVEYRMVI